MHVVFGIIILALLILAVRVIWHTLKTTWLWLSQWRAHFQRVRFRNSEKIALPARFTRQPALPSPDWDDMSQLVRQSLLERNHHPTYRLDALDIDLQVKLKTQAILQAEIEITQLQRTLAEAQQLLAQPVKKRRNQALPLPAKKPNPAAGLRKALQGDKSASTSHVH